MSLPSPIDAPGRGDPTAARLEEHLQVTAKRLIKLGVRPGDCIASVLPHGPDAVSAGTAVGRARAIFAPLTDGTPGELLELNAKLLLVPAGLHPIRDAAHAVGIPVANVLRHFEAGVFTLESAISPPPRIENPPTWKSQRRSRVPLILISPDLAYRPLANRLDANNPVIGITPPSLEHLPSPHTIEHVAAECVRMLRRCRPEGPYALAGVRAEGLIALEIARLLEEGGEKIAFVAMLDAASLFRPRRAFLRRLFSRRKLSQSCDFMAEALRQYRPHPWYGKMLHIGKSPYEGPSEMLAEPNVQRVATILAAELDQSRL